MLFDLISNSIEITWKNARKDYNEISILSWEPSFSRLQRLIKLDSIWLIPDLWGGGQLAARDRSQWPNRIKLIEFKDGEDDISPLLLLSSLFSFDPSVSFGTCVGGVSPLHVAKLRWIIDGRSEALRGTFENVRGKHLPGGYPFRKIVVSESNAKKRRRKKKRERKKKKCRSPP